MNASLTKSLRLILLITEAKEGRSEACNRYKKILFHRLPKECRLSHVVMQHLFSPSIIDTFLSRKAVRIRKIIHLLIFLTDVPPSNIKK